MKVFLDLDGTLLDVSERYYRVYRDLLATAGDAALPKAWFWEMKRMRADDGAILAATGAGMPPDLFSARKQERLEWPEYLKLDTLLADVTATLNALLPRVPLFLVTRRRNADRLAAQLRELGISHFFQAVRSVSGRPTGETKEALLRALGCAPEDFVVGDSDADVLAGKAVGARTVAVTTGLRDRAVLEAMGPEFLIRRLGELVAIVAELQAIRRQAHA
jgi:phosphoglycolate phosphatase